MYLCFNIWIEKGRWTWVEPKCSERRKMQSKKEVLTIEWMAHVQGHEVYQMRALSWWFSSGTTGRFLLWNNYFEQLKWLNEVEFLLQWIWFCSVTLSVVFFFYLLSFEWFFLNAPTGLHSSFISTSPKKNVLNICFTFAPVRLSVSFPFGSTLKQSNHQSIFKESLAQVFEKNSLFTFLRIFANGLFVKYPVSSLI